MKSNGLKEGHYFNKIAPKDTKMCLEVFVEAMIVGWFVFTRLFLNVTFTVNLEQFSILSTFSKILKTLDRLFQNVKVPMK